MIILLIAISIFIASVIIFCCLRVSSLTEEYEKELDQASEDLNARDKTIGDYEITITEKKNKIQEDEKEISKLKTEIEETKQKLSNTIRDTNSTIDSLNIQLETKSNLLIKETKKNIELEKKLKEKELKRIASVGTANSKQKKISNLENEIKELKEEHKKELLVKDNAIKFWKEKCKQPDVEDVKAYDFQQKEVEKRNKKGHHERNMEAN